MRRLPYRGFLATATLGLLVATAGPSLSDRGDCGQPTSFGSTPSVVDVLAILRWAVGQTTDCTAKPCVCDLNSDGRPSVVDAWLALRSVVRPCLIEPWLCGPSCSCPASYYPCTSFEITALPESWVDLGWTGLAHKREMPHGSSITARVKRVCSGTGDIECRHHEDCPEAEVCAATCDCGIDTSCEITGPTHARKCVNTLADCVADRCIVSGTTTATPCASNADCGEGTCTGAVACAPGVACVAMAGPPQPLALAGSPFCVVTYFDGPLAGSVHTATGEASVSTNMRARMFLGENSLAQPCPVCGAADENPKPGDLFTCDGGPSHAEACTVEAVTESFGGTSSHCPPSPQLFLSSLAVRLQEITTATTTKSATLPCAFFGFRGNPLVPDSNPTCLDTNQACTSNADCTRCTFSPETPCSSNADCGEGGGSCAEAPAQPVSCGFWCHCGLCDDDPDRPCFHDGDCGGQGKCTPGTGSGTQPNAAQTKPNACENDGFVCGGVAAERCATTLVGSCTEQPLRTCSSDAACLANDAGLCVFETKPCFESEVVRAGRPSPLGSYCAFQDKPCSFNADCTANGDFCLDSTAKPSMAALFCTAGSSSSVVKTEAGLPGPGALSLNSLVKVCYCGDGEIGCDENCDDGDAVPGDGCDEYCHLE